MKVLIFTFVLWYGGLFFQTFFLHRYSAHQMFTMSKTIEKICFVLTWLFQGPNYLSAYGYGIMHRMHHDHADTEKDPHSPKYDKNLFHMMWRTKNNYQKFNNEYNKVDVKYTRNVPQWKLFDNFASSYFSRIVWSIIYLSFFYLYADYWWEWLLFPVVLCMAPIHGMIINWFAHVYGYVNFKVSDSSKNLFPFDFLMMGEGYHNNHHKHCGNPNFGGVRWHEFDPTYYIIVLLDKLRLIKLKSKSKGVLKKRFIIDNVKKISPAKLDLQ